MKSNPLAYILILPYLYLTIKLMSAARWMDYAYITFAFLAVLYIGHYLYMIFEKLNEKR